MFASPLRYLHLAWKLEVLTWCIYIWNFAPNYFFFILMNVNSWLTVCSLNRQSSSIILLIYNRRAFKQRSCHRNQNSRQTFAEFSGWCSFHIGKALKLGKPGSLWEYARNIGKITVTLIIDLDWKITSERWRCPSSIVRCFSVYFSQMLKKDGKRRALKCSERLHSGDLWCLFDIRATRLFS